MMMMPEKKNLRCQQPKRCCMIIEQKGVFSMEDTSVNKNNRIEIEAGRRICAGILAHVDAGKTTLAEGILYVCGSIRKWGRVDHGDAFLDTYDLERERGITIFSKQAELSLGDRQVTLLDTPGHVDFSAEMERTLQVLDYAILVISGTDGVQGHVLTLWKLLVRYSVPVFLFINKMDQPGTDRGRILEELRRRLDERCVDFGCGSQGEGQEEQPEFYEQAAMCGEKLLEEYLETGRLEEDSLRDAIRRREIFPCFFGSALKMQGVKEFLEGFRRYSVCPEYPKDFGARIYKIGRDEKGTRLTYMKITGGSLKVKALLTNAKAEGEEGDQVWEEKADQIRIYSGAQYEAVNEAEAGTICAVAGLTRTKSGEGLGIESGGTEPLLSPVLNYQILLPEGSDYLKVLSQLRQLEEEEPQLHIVWNEKLGEIHAQVMGEVQIEILKRLMEDRFGIPAEFGSGSIVYKETIGNTVEGVGHFEPLRHYAEVHLLMEPGERGSGLVFASSCSEDVLERSWQRLILTHLEERIHPGVLTGSEITDMKITLVAGRAHLKHTEGGDFRQATYRAVRQGLRKAECVLLEPVYEFMLEVPTSMVGRAMADIQRMHGEFQPPVQEGELSLITGMAPVATMGGYQTQVAAYGQGMGRLSCTVKGYEPCHNTEEVLAQMGYDPDADVENPTGSVFCSHGAGFYVPWDQVEQYMHLESVMKKPAAEDDHRKSRPAVSSGAAKARSLREEDKELEEIFLRTYGRGQKRQRPGGSSGHAERRRDLFQKTEKGRKKADKEKDEEPTREYLLVDGYNIIFSWEELRELAAVSIEAARHKLMDILSNYQGYRGGTLILVYDAYKVEGSQGEVSKYHNIHVIYTKEAETADQYIEKAVHEIAKKHHVTVATSDALEQVIIWGQGARRMSAQDLLDEVERVGQEIRGTYLSRPARPVHRLFDHLPDQLSQIMEEIRLGRKKI